MKRVFILITVFLLGLGFAQAAEATWLTDFKAAQKKAEAEKKPLVVNFTGSDWCGWCIRLDKEVFSQAEFVDYADKNLVLVKLDFPRKKELSEAEKAQNQELAGRYGIRGFPTIMVFDAKGAPMGKLGYQKGGAIKWIESLEKVTKP